MFAYCLNNPVGYTDSQGFLAAAFYDADGEMFSSDELDERSGGGNRGFWQSLLDSVTDAANGLTVATGEKSGIQQHHYLSNKNKTYSPQFKEYTDKYGLDLDGDWNVETMQNHTGRHTNKYHEFMLGGLKEIDCLAKGDPSLFLEGFSVLKGFVNDHSWLPYGK